MDRRQFLTRSTSCLGAGLGAGLGGALGSRPAGAAPGPGPARDPATNLASFEAGLARDRRLLGFRSAAGDVAPLVPQTQGHWPRDLTGTFLRNGPARHDLGGQRYDHWFDGDGMIQRWQVGPDGARFDARFIATPKHVAERTAGRFLFPAGGGTIEGSAPMTGPDSVNAANTNLLPLADGRLWALWEGGSASAINPQTLDFEGFVTLSRATRGAPFSAHPRTGADGRVWNIGAMGALLALYRLSPDGTLEAVRTHRIAPVGLIHDFILTERSVVVVLPSTRIGMAGDGLFGRIRAAPAEPIVVMVFDRETLELTRTATLPAGMVFHFGNGWEEADGTIRFDMVHGADADSLQSFRDPMRGRMPDSSQTRSLLVTLPPRGAVRLELVAGRVEFPRIASRRATRRHRHVVMPQIGPGVGPGAGWFDRVVLCDLETGRTRTAHYGPDWLVEEHQLIARPGATAEDDGWLVGTALDWRRGRSALSVFDARAPEAGPVARLWLPLAMPLGFHGQWVGRS